MMELLRAILFLPPGASSFADGIDTLHFVVIGTTVLGALGVFAVAAGFVWRFHRSRRPRKTPHVVAGRRFEAITIGGILVMFVSFWVVGFSQYAEMREPPGDALEIFVVARQWMWQFAGSDGLRSEGVLVVPRGRDVRLLLTSRDVIHSFFVPAFRLKQDLVPGLTTAAWFRAERDGVYPLFCAEYCGTEHSLMRASVVVLSPEAYARHHERQLAIVAQPSGDATIESEDEMSRRGRVLAASYGCFACHTLDGQRHVGPTWRGLYLSERTLEGGETRIADAAYLTESMMEPEEAVVAGFEPVMPSYQGVLSAGDVAALVELIRSARASDLEPAVRLPPVEARAAPSPSDEGERP
jgi:cytochrome c oxidase subunit 2